MESTTRLAFDDFLRALRDAYRVTFAGMEEQAALRAADVRLFATTFGAGFLFTTLFIA